MNQNVELSTDIELVATRKLGGKMITNWDEKSYRNGKCQIGIASKYSKIECVLLHLQLCHTTGYPSKMLTRTVTYTGNQKSNEGRSTMMCDFSYPTTCYVRIQELSVQPKDHVSHRKTEPACWSERWRYNRSYSKTPN